MNEEDEVNELGEATDPTGPRVSPAEQVETPSRRANLIDTSAQCARKAAFLRSLATHGVVRTACLETGCQSNLVYGWRKTDPAFADGWALAVDMATQRLEAEADRRGRDGYSREVFQGGKHVGYVTEYSDTLLMFRLKSLRPEMYRERYEVKPIASPVNVDTSALSDDEKRMLEALLSKALGGGVAIEGTPGDPSQSAESGVTVSDSSEVINNEPESLR